jgi:hypothetical protein
LGYVNSSAYDEAYWHVVKHACTRVTAVYNADNRRIEKKA